MKKSWKMPLRQNYPKRLLKSRPKLHLHQRQREPPPVRSRTRKYQNQRLRSNQALVHRHRTGLKRSVRFPIRHHRPIPPIGSRDLRLMEKRHRLNRRQRLLIGSKGLPKRERREMRAAPRLRPIGSEKLVSLEASRKSKPPRKLIPRAWTTNRRRSKRMKVVERRIGCRKSNPLLTKGRMQTGTTWRLNPQ